MSSDHTRCVTPGTATSSAGSDFQSKCGGVRSNCEPLMSQSHVTGMPVYALIRPMIAVSVLSATCFPSFNGASALMLAIRSACSCTYGFGEGLSVA